MTDDSATAFFRQASDHVGPFYHGTRAALPPRNAKLIVKATEGYQTPEEEEPDRFDATKLLGQHGIHIHPEGPLSAGVDDTPDLEHTIQVHPQDTLHTEQGSLNGKVLDHYRQQGTAVPHPPTQQRDHEDPDLPHRPTVVTHNGQNWLTDGHHRVLVHRERGEPFTAWHVDADRDRREYEEWAAARQAAHTATAFFRQGSEHSGPFYHGTAHEFQPGDMVDPSYELGGRKGNSHAFMTTDPDVAHNYAKHKAWVAGMFDDTVKPHAYEVRPTGPIEEDDTVDGKFRAFRTRHPMKVVREVHPGKEASLQADLTATGFFRHTGSTDEGGSDVRHADDQRTAGRGKPRREPGAGGGAAAQGEDSAGAARPVGDSAATPRPVTFHPAAEKELSKIEPQDRKRIKGTIDSLAARDPNVQTHALTLKLKGWHSTKSSRGHRIVHRTLDDGTLHVGYVGLHDYDTAIRRLTTLQRGLSLQLDPAKHAFVHDPKQPLPARAHMLLSELRKPTSAIDGEDIHGGSGGLGEFWTRSRNVADDASAAQDEQRTGRGATTHVTVHAHEPSSEHYWHEMAGYPDHPGNYRVPLRPGAPLGVHGITWSTPGGDEHHYDFSQPVDKVASTATSFFRQAEAVEHLDLYHRTTPEAADAIYRDKRMHSKENLGGRKPLYFSTFRGDEPDAAGRGYGEGIVHVRVPHHIAEIDDEFPSGEEHYLIDQKDLRPEHFVDDRQQRTAARTPYSEDISNDRPVTFQYHRNTESSTSHGDFGSRYGQDIEPHGRYVSQGPYGGQPDDSRWEQGEVTFQRPLRMHFGGGYEESTNWKRQLSDRYSGKTGRELSQAIRDDGYDGIMTHDEYGPSETVDLTGFKPRTGTSQSLGAAIMRQAAAERQTGMMVAIVPPREVAEDLALPDGEPVHELHITLAYLGKTPDYTAEQVAWLPELVGSWAARQHPVKVRIGGTGKFSNESSGEHVLWAAADIPGGAQLHSDLAAFLEGHGYRLPSEHGWLPHLTLAYVHKHFRFLPKVAEHSWDAAEVWTCVGGKWTRCPLGGIHAGHEVV